MIKMTSKKKYLLLKIIGVFLVIINIAALTTICILLKWDYLWKNIEKDGISNFNQWITLVRYRLGLYLLPGLILSFFKFDKRYKFFSRLKLWYNWTFCVCLIANAIIKVFSIDLVFEFTFFTHLDSVVLLIGYIMTYITKEGVSFDSTEAIINPKKVND